VSLSGTRRAISPDGTEWTVRPRWRAGPDVRIPHRWRGRRGRGDLLDFADLPLGGDDLVSGIVFFVVAIVFVVLVVFLVWPLIAIAVELLIAVLLVGVAAIGRLAFGKPWVIEAVSPRRTLRYEVRGYGAMRRVVTEIADQLQTGNATPRPTSALLVTDPGRR
jgi:VIT1/CCC1 family predicted Fe2+/Mn2+ transporter